MNLIMLNDTVSINNNYREKLVEELNSSVSKVICIGLFDKISVSKILAISSLLLTTTFIISSNLRSNIFSMIFFWTKGLVILNGIGRHRDKTTLRTILLLLFKLNWRKKIVVQSYADYRYFKRYSSKGYFWIPGSGGSYKTSGPKEVLLLVQRDSKIKLIFQSVFGLLKIMQDRNIAIVGCRDNKMTGELFQDYKVNLVGRQKPEDIFLAGGTFIQPAGYGEGFPHSLADAIVSDLDIYIDSKEFMRYGLSRLGGSKQNISNNWCMLKGLKEIAITINSKQIIESYLKVIKNHI